MAEFDLIERYFNFKYEFGSDSATPNTNKPRIVKGIGDDCAIFHIPTKHFLVTSTDTLVEGIHFFHDLPPEDIAYKALAANVSDLCAMGAKPLAFTLSITLPHVDHAWLEGFSHGLKQSSEQYNIPLVGGDTTQGPLTITITANGSVKQGRLLQRDMAEVGQDLWITGYLGEAAAALELYDKKLHSQESLSASEQKLWRVLTHPQPPVKFAQKLTKVVSCGLDISDGLMADLGHILNQSDCGAWIDVASLPVSEALIDAVGLDQARQYGLNGGDDYQLCFTANKEHRNKILNLAERFDINVTRVGKITQKDITVELEGDPYVPERSSWQHFNY